MSDDDLKLDDYGDLVLGDGDATLVDDMEALCQDIRHRLMTVKGSLVADADYGGSLPLYLHMHDHPVNRRVVTNAIEMELAKETRILPQRTTVQITALDTTTVELRIAFVRKSDLQPGSVTVGLTS